MSLKLNRWTGLAWLGMLLAWSPVAQGAQAAAAGRGVVRIGVQPLGYPAAMVGSVLGRDAILKRELARRGHMVQFIPFRKGNDMVELMGKSLSAGLLGDMPTIRMAARTEICVAGLIKSTFTSVVGSKVALSGQLKGKRVGYSEGSSAHHTLLQALASVGLTDRDLKLVPLDVDAMPDALEQGRIDAFSGWEPATTIALARSNEARVLFRGASSDFFILSRELVRDDPDGALEVVASLVRALNWMRKSSANLRQAALWAARDGEAMSRAATRLTPSQAMEIAHRELLDVPAAPVIPRRSGQSQPLSEQFNFLKSLGKIPKDASLQSLDRAFAYDGLQRVLKSPRRYRLGQFDYRP